MTVRIHPHARDRMAERGATEHEVALCIDSGERFAARFGRTAFRRNFAYAGTWRGRWYATKQVEVVAVEEAGSWLAITVLVKYF